MHESRRFAGLLADGKDTCACRGMDEAEAKLQADRSQEVKGKEAGSVAGALLHHVPL